MVQAVGFQQRRAAQQRPDQEELSRREPLLLQIHAALFGFTSTSGPLFANGSSWVAASIAVPIMSRRANGEPLWPSTSP